MSLEIKGLEKLLSQLTALPETIKETSLEVLEEKADEVLSASAPLVPVDEGDLIGSAYIEKTDDGVAFGYSEDYALEVHEDLDAYHDDGQAKFLEQPYNEMKPSIASTLIEAVKKAIK